MPKIRIDATSLDYAFFIIPGRTDWTDARVVQELDLPAGTYNYQIGSGFYCDFTFSVTPDGKIAYDPKFEAFLDGAGTATLRLAGFAVTLDARYMPGSGIIWCGDIPSTGWFQRRQCRLLPASFYRVQQGSGIVCDLAFKLDGDGRFQYDAALDAGSGGPLRGKGSTTLEFLGFPILVDARRAGGAGLMVHPVAWGMTFATNQVVMFNVLPAAGFQIQLDSGVVTNAGFDVDKAGKITPRNDGGLTVAVDSFHGLARVSVQRLLRGPIIKLPPIRGA